MSNIMHATAIRSKVLASTRLATTNATAVLEARDKESIEVVTATACNTHSSTVTVTVSVVPAGETNDGTHAALSALPIAAGDTASLKEIAGGLRLGPGDCIYVTASVAAKVCIVLTGEVTS